ncbi:hypothetical protein LUZ63_002486 [Rhynchospora breviuscula]|uniref:Reverse transcriptase Ty1/copia-type domain-containing protein n=1 Tax=Rhynchospora breviuscula TaxID=2022672 RepID=A0A9Q0CYU1_9POAL|nr:hypothetical protein LUZ63_002486 [Rhynchospora breviuscula]
MLDKEPTTFAKASPHPERRQAMMKEFDALAANHTWTLVPPPLDQKVIGCKWIYKIQRKSDGSIERYKSRLVAKGFNQQEDLGFVHYFLGIEVLSCKTGMQLSQTKYIMDILSKANMVHAKPWDTTTALGSPLYKDDGPPFENPKSYRTIVGALQYATLTRPDISFAVNCVSQYIHQPTIPQWTAVKRILRYLCGSLNLKLHLNPSHSLTIDVYCDANWAGCPDDRRSTTGFCLYLGGNLVSWSAKKQHTVSRSSTEAEYRSLVLTCAEILWLQYLLNELYVSLATPPTLWCDNIRATFLASNPIFHARTKYIEIDYHFVRERVATKQLRV